MLQLLIYLGGIMVLFYSGSGRADQVMRVSCAAPADMNSNIQNAVCREVIHRAAEAAPGHVPQRVPPGEERPENAQDIGIALVLTGGGPSHLRGRLDWQNGSDEDVATGPEIDFDVMDAKLTPVIAASFARGLFASVPDFTEGLSNER